MNKTWLIIGLIVAIVLGLFIFGNIYADGRKAVEAKRKPKEPKSGVKLYATDETVNLEHELMGR